YEHVRAHHLAVFPGPARQGLCATAAAALQVDDRLVAEHDLPPLDGVAQFRSQAQVAAGKTQYHIDPEPDQQQPQDTGQQEGREVAVPELAPGLHRYDINAEDGTQGEPGGDPLAGPVDRKAGPQALWWRQNRIGGDADHGQTLDPEPDLLVA